MYSLLSYRFVPPIQTKELGLINFALQTRIYKSKFEIRIFYIGYHLSVTKLNGLSPNFLFKYHQHKSLFHHQIKLFITKFNKFSPNELIFLSPNILTSHQKEWYKAKPVLSTKHSFLWQFCDQNKEIVSSFIYFHKLTIYQSKI